MADADETLFIATVHAFLSVYRHLRHYSRQMHEEGLSGRKIATLRYLLEAGPRTVGQLRDYLYLSDSSTSELVAGLEQQGHVARERSTADNRVVVVSLTTAGEEAARRAPLGGIPLLRERLRALPPERLARVKAALEEVRALLEVPDGR